MSKIATKWIADDAVTAAKLNADCAGAGLVPNGGTGALDVNPDGTTLEISGDAVQIKDLGVDTAQLAGTSVTAAKLGSDVAGDGLTGGNGSDLDVQPDTTGGANLGKVINVSSNGVAVKIDDSTIGENGSNQLEVKANGIDATHIDETDDYTWTGTHDFTGGTVHVPTPSADTHPATKAYADALKAGLRQKDMVRALRDSNITLSGDPSNIDGVTSWTTGDRVLCTGQTTGSENGIWEVNTSGAWTRPTDFDTGDHASGATMWVDQGTNYGETQWTCTTNDPNDVIDTNSLAFTQSSAPGQVTAGTGLTKSGSIIHIGDGTTGNINGINRSADEISAAVDNSTIEVSSNLIQIKALGVGTTELAATSVTAAKLGNDVAGDGLTGGNGSDIDVQPDTTGGANLGKVINVSANGVAVKIDDSTIGENGSNQLFVKNGGITETQLNTSVGGAGISGGGGSALALDINELTAETSADNADTIAIYDATATAIRKMTRANFLSGVGGGGTHYQEAHLITSGEDTNGYFTLSNTPNSAGEVTAYVDEGIYQNNKQVVGATGATPDFDILSSNQFHFNNNGAATGLSGDLSTNDVVFIHYTY